MSVDIQSKVQEIIKRLEQVYPNKIELEFSTDFELLIAIILSAQTTDKKTNQVTKKLFSVYKTPQDFANASLEAIRELIKSINYSRRKSQFIKEVSKKIVELGYIPKSIDKLVEFPGIGRKSAAMFLYNAYRINEGIAVDTHVKRVANRLGLSKSETPQAIEEDLMKITPQQDWGKLSNLLILHGRYTCTANKPKCNVCLLRDMCPYYGA